MLGSINAFKRLSWEEHWPFLTLAYCVDFEGIHDNLHQVCFVHLVPPSSEKEFYVDSGL